MRALPTHPPIMAPYSHILFLLAALIFLHVSSTSSVKSEGEILLKFKESLKNVTALSTWTPAKPPCQGKRRNWDGVMCEDGEVRGLNLNGMGLRGTIDVDSLTALTGLRVFGVMYNNFDGPLPEFKKLGALKHLYLSRNKFSGEIPSDAFEGMNSLKKLHLAHNAFVGPIPSSLATLGKLVELVIQNNKFDGKLPDFKQHRFTMVNFSNNLLVGEIPPALSKLKVSSFEGNPGLCGAPLKECVKEPKLSTGTKAVSGIALAATAVAILAVIVILATRKRVAPAEEGGAATATAAAAQRKAAPSDELDKVEKGSNASSSPAHSTASSSSESSKKPDQSVKLSFLIEGRERFGLPDLLKASAEILGNGIFGATYKAALTAGPVMVVKRFKHMNNVGKEDFHEHMRRLGRLSNENLLPIVAFYYRKEEKLLVSDFVDNSSLASHLHGNNKSGGSQPSLDWPTRLKIVKGVAKGLSYLYTELPSLTAPHGHLKSTNVLLTSSYAPLLNDYGLLPVVNLEHAQEHMIAYKSPEYRQGGRITKKTDVWALGILILEILTGKLPEKFAQQGKKGSDSDLASWVESAVGDGAAAEVFDKEMVKDGCLEEMVKLLKIGMSCCDVDVDKRWDIKEAVKSIEEVRERDGEK